MPTLVALAAWLVACDQPTAPTATTTAPAATTTAAATSGAASAAATSAQPAEAAPELIAAQHVLIAYRGAKRPPKGVTRSKAEAKKLAEEVAAKAKAGEDFGALASQYSDDTANKDRLGSVGKFKRDGMVKPFSDAAFALAVGETSGVVETEFGFHVIKRNQ